jgi:methyl-accepting chemotaxis protein
MGIRLKINLVLAAITLLALAATALALDGLLQASARRQVLEQARVMLEAAGAMRAYTDQQVSPHLIAKMDALFLPQAVPAYAATESFAQLQKRYRNYSYKEATLNPTNPRDRPVDWEADLVQQFRRDAKLTELVGDRAGVTGTSLFIARPIAADDAACLQCHGVPQSAPASMLKLYGAANGFGWKAGEVVGAQIVTVPMELAVQSAREALLASMAAMVAIFAVVFAALNVMLGMLVVRPVARMAADADRISLGDFSVDEFAPKGRDEVAVLGDAFNRMRRSLHKAMQLLAQAPRRPGPVQGPPS